MKNMIITADDYGMCKSVNHAIEDCMVAGSVTSTSIMANMVYAEDAIIIKKNIDAVSLGLHWNLTTGKPLLPPYKVKSIVDEYGNFLSFDEFRKKWLFGYIKKNDIILELTEQYNHFQIMLGKPVFWNTHENIHVWFGIFNVFVELGLSLGIHSMRSHSRFTLPKNISGRLYELGHPLYMTKTMIINKWCADAKKSGYKMPDGVLHLPGFPEGKIVLPEISDRIDWIKYNNAIEILIHPATNIDLELFGNLQDSRVLEYNTYKNPSFRQSLINKNINLMNFGNLK